jgi:inorganic pyrophosphatase
MKTKILAATLAAMAVAASAGAQQWVHPFSVPQTDSTGQDFFAVIEIPQGGSIKYEILEDTGYVYVDRFTSMAVNYPANYGSIPSSEGGDGDPLDVLVLTRQPVAPGALIRVRAVGVLKMIDDGEVDDKLLAVPTSAIDPTYDGVETIADLPEMEIQRIEQFFAVYKNLPEGANTIELRGWEDAAAAQAMVDEALAAARAAD